jgi:RNA polymerase sigma-70 factor (ECF subfamily)
MENFETVLAAAQRGDRRAADELFRAHQPMLLRYLRSQERRVADDLAGEVWLAAAAALPEFRGTEAGYRSWLFTVARRRVIEHRRRGIRRRTDVVDPVIFLESSATDDPATTAAESLDAQAAVDLIADLLSPEQAEVLILRTVADLSAADVAELMGRPESWVRVTQHRALKRLRAHLAAPVEVTT